MNNGADFQCPLTGLPMNGRYRFFAFRSSGLVVSEKALKEVLGSPSLWRLPPLRSLCTWVGSTPRAMLRGSAHYMRACRSPAEQAGAAGWASLEAAESACSDFDFAQAPAAVEELAGGRWAAEDLLPLNGSAQEVAALRERMLLARAAAKRRKDKRKAGAVGAAEELGASGIPAAAAAAAASASSPAVARQGLPGVALCATAMRAWRYLIPTYRCAAC